MVTTIIRWQNSACLEDLLSLISLLYSIFIKRFVVSILNSLGHADAEIEAVFAKYDLDGDRILNEEEQVKMQRDLEGQKVHILLFLFLFL